MFKRVFISSLIATLFLTACGGPEQEFSIHSSDEGYVPEAFIPANVGMMFSYSLQDDGQYAAVKAIEEKLGDSGRLSRTVSENLDQQFADSVLDYDRDLAPAFGEQFRLVYAARPADEEADVFSVVTLQDADRMVDVLQKLVEADELEEKRLSRLDAYVDEANDLYMTIYEDVLLVSNRPEELVAMHEMGSEGGKDSLWKSETYQESLERIGSDNILYGQLFPDYFEQTLDLPAGFGVSAIPSVIDTQSLVVRAQENGFYFDAYVNANEKEAKAADISFDVVPKSDPYLFEEVPAEGLMAYLESYGMAQTFAQADKLGDDPAQLEELDKFFTSYFAMDFEEDVLSFLDKGYAVMLHQNGNGVVPGFSLMADVSSDEEGAEDFVNKLDGQVAGLLLLLESALPGAVTKGTMNVDGNTLYQLEIDLGDLARTGISPLPASVTDSPIQLVYGLMGDRMLVSTAEVWGQESVSIEESEIYETLSAELDDVEQGLILIDVNGLAGFTAALRALREQLDLGVSDSALEFEDFLQGFEGAIAASKTEAYSSHFSGVLLLEE